MLVREGEVIILCQDDAVTTASCWIVADERGRIHKEASLYGLAAPFAHDLAIGNSRRADLIETKRTLGEALDRLDAPDSGTGIFCPERAGREHFYLWRGFNVGAVGAGIAFHFSRLADHWPLPSVHLDGNRFGQERQIRWGWAAEDWVPGLRETREASEQAQASLVRADAAKKQDERRRSIETWGSSSPFWSEIAGHLSPHEWDRIWQTHDFSELFPEEKAA